MVNNKDSFHSFKLFPDPVKFKVKIQIPEKLVGSSLKTIDSLGHLIAQGIIAQRLLSKNLSAHYPWFRWAYTFACNSINN